MAVRKPNENDAKTGVEEALLITFKSFIPQAYNLFLFFELFILFFSIYNFNIYFHM